MRMKIAGGCGEHGRNCFYIETSKYAFLVDCGLMAGEAGGGYPHLTEAEIKRLDYVFLTHSHADHTGALPWITANGFDGFIVGSEETLSQLPFPVNNAMTLEQYQAGNHPISMEYGRSGHCVGSVWYQFECEGKTLFFSGDYVEKNYVHEIDLIREKQADIAVVDCAYGNDKTSFDSYCTELVKYVRKAKTEYRTLLFPVPKYGRGLEIYWLLKKRFPKWTFSGDAHFIKQVISAQESKWIKKDVVLSGDISLFSEEHPTDVVFASDPQLRKAEAQEIAEKVLEHGYAIMTGTVESGTMSARLLEEGKMSMLRFPVHLNYPQFRNVAMNNSFKQIIIYHSPEFDCEKEIIK